MNFVRKSVLVLITPIFILLLFVTATDVGVARVVTHPTNIEKMLDESGVYNTSVNGLLDQAKQISDTGNGGDVPLNDPAIRSAANSTFTPQFLRSNTEMVIDSIYGWLDGKTTQPNFSIDLTNAKNQFAAAVAKSVETRAASLPACTAANTPSDFDGLSATCLPPGTTPAAAAAKIQANILSGKGFLDHPVITADSIKSPNSCNQPPDRPCPSGSKDTSIFNDKLKNAPEQYQRAKKTPVILSVITVLLAILIAFLGATRRKGLRHLGVLVLIVGLFMLAFSWGLNYAFTQKAVPKISLNNAVLEKNVKTLLTDVEQKVDQNYWLFGGIYTVLGIAAIATASMWGGRGPKGEAVAAPTDIKSKDHKIDLREPDRVSALTRPPKKPAKKTVKIQ